jgi:hypothetical protein
MTKRKDRSRNLQIYANLERIACSTKHAGKINAEPEKLTTIFGQNIRVATDSSKTLRMKKFRFQLFHQWLIQNFEPLTVADIGGGKGLLSYLLQKSGWNPTVIDPYPQTLPEKYKDIVTGARLKIDPQEKIPYIAEEFIPELAEPFDLLVGLHAHGCNTKIIDAAAKVGCGFVIFPCCIIDEPFYPPLGVHWLESLADYALMKGCEITPFRLNFKGQNIGLCRIDKIIFKNAPPS